MIYTSASEAELQATRRTLIHAGVAVSLIGWNPTKDLYEFNTVK